MRDVPEWSKAWLQRSWNAYAPIGLLRPSVRMNPPAHVYLVRYSTGDLRPRQQTRGVPALREVRQLAVGPSMCMID